MNIKKLIKEYIHAPLEQIGNGESSPEDINEQLGFYQSGINYLNSQPIREILNRLLLEGGVKPPKDTDNDYILLYGEDKNGNVLDRDELIKEGTDIPTNLLGSEYIHITKNIQTIFAEIKLGNIIVRLNHSRPYSENGEKQSGITVAHVIHLPLGDMPLVVGNPIVMKPNSLINKYIYPMMNENGTVSINALTVSDK